MWDSRACFDLSTQGYELPTAWEWVGAVLLTFVAPTSYCAFTFMLHGDFVSRVNKVRLVVGGCCDVQSMYTNIGASVCVVVAWKQDS